MTEVAETCGEKWLGSIVPIYCGLPPHEEEVWHEATVIHTKSIHYSDPVAARLDITATEHVTWEDPFIHLEKQLDRKKS